METANEDHGRYRLHPSGGSTVPGGLPDLEPLQKAAMGQIEKRMMAEFERYSPEEWVKSWLTPLNVDWLNEIMKNARK